MNVLDGRIVSAADEEGHAHANPGRTCAEGQRDLVIEVQTSADENGRVDPDVALEESVTSDNPAEFGENAPFAGQEEVPLQRDGGPEFGVATVTTGVGVDAEGDGNGVVDLRDEEWVADFDRRAKATTNLDGARATTVGVAATTEKRGAIGDEVEVGFEFGAVGRVRARALDDPIDGESVRGGRDEGCDGKPSGKGKLLRAFHHVPLVSVERVRGNGA